MEEKKICPNCSAEFGIKFKCDYCGKIFCDYCEVKTKISPKTTHFFVKFFCPICDGTSTRIPIPFH